MDGWKGRGREGGDCSIAARLTTHPHLSPAPSTLVAPPQLEGKSYGWACDWWALGCVMFELYTGAHLIEEEIPPIADKTERKDSVSKKIASAAHAPKDSWLPRFEASRFCSPEAVELMHVLLHGDPTERGEILRLVGLPYFEGMDFELLPLRAHDMPFIPDPEASNCDGGAAVMDAFEEDEVPTCKEYVGEEDKPFVGFEHNTTKKLNRKTNRMSFSRARDQAPLYAKRRQSVTPAQRRIMSHQQRVKKQAFTYVPDMQDARSCESQQSKKSLESSYELHRSARVPGSGSSMNSSGKLESVGEDVEATNMGNKIVPLAELRRPAHARSSVGAPGGLG